MSSQTVFGLQGWSNGSSAVLATMSNYAPSITSRTPSTGFRAALAFYPGCGLKQHFTKKPFHPYALVLLLHGTDDDEVSYRRYRRLVQRSVADGGAIEIRLYEDATHSFDTPIRSRQRVPANAAAREEAVERSLRFFARYLKSRQ